MRRPSPDPWADTCREPWPWRPRAGAQPGRGPAPGASTFLPTHLGPSFKHLRGRQRRPGLQPLHRCHRSALQRAKAAPCRTMPWHPAPLGQGKLRQAEPASPPSPAGGWGLPPAPTLPAPAAPARAGRKQAGSGGAGLPRALFSPSPARTRPARDILLILRSPDNFRPGSAHGTALPPHSHLPPGPGGADSSAGHFGSPRPRRRGGRRRRAGRAASHTVFGLNQAFMLGPGGFHAQTVCTESGGRQPEPWELQPPLSGLLFFF